MYWRVPKIWEGGCVWIIGGGPSIPKLFNVPDTVVKKVLEGELDESAYSPYMKAIHDEHIIGVNAAFLLGDWIDVVFFGDSKFFLKFRQQLEHFGHLKISCAQAALKQNWVHSLRRDRKHRRGISVDPTAVSWCGNSGCAAISLAYNAGVKKVFLLGFDMKLDDNCSQHWHSRYKKTRTSKNPAERKNLPFHKHLPAFPVIAKDAKRLGLEIYNVSPDSAIDCLPKITLEKALDLAREMRDKEEQIVINKRKGKYLPPPDTGEKLDVILKKQNDEEGLKLTIITPVTRPENLQEIARRVPDKCNWLLILDPGVDRSYLPEKGKCYSIPQRQHYFKRNFALDMVKSGHVYFLDDDTVVHPDFHKLLDLSPEYDFIHFNQSFPDGEHRVGGHVKVNQIDIGNYIISRELIGDTRLKQVTKRSDGYFAEDIYPRAKNILYLNETYSIYNALNKKNFKCKAIEAKIPYGLNESLADAYNKAMESANTDWVLLIDHDVLLCNPYWYEMCLNAINKVEDNTGLITCVTNYLEGFKGVKRYNVQSADIVETSGDIEKHIEVARKLYEKYGSDLKEISTHKVAGFFMLINKRIWKTIKFKDAGKGVGMIDHFYCKRLLNSGFKIYEMPGLYVFHRRDLRQLNWKKRQGEVKIINRKYKPAIDKDVLRVVCFKWKHINGFKLMSLEIINEYTAEYVNKLFRGVERNLTIPHEFVCVTDDPEGVECRTIPMWNEYRELGGCYSRLKLFSPEMEDVLGKRFVMIDLDSVIVGNLDKLFSRKEDFIINKYLVRAPKYREQWYNGSLIMMNAGSRCQVWDSFKGEESVKIINKKKEEGRIVGTDQAWISYTLGPNEALFTEEQGVYYAKRLLKKKELPENARIITFAGRRDPSSYVDNPYKYALNLDWVKKNWV